MLIHYYQIWEICRYFYAL